MVAALAVRAAARAGPVRGRRPIRPGSALSSRPADQGRRRQGDQHDRGPGSEPDAPAGRITGPGPLPPGQAAIRFRLCVGVARRTPHARRVSTEESDHLYPSGPPASDNRIPYALNAPIGRCWKAQNLCPDLLAVSRDGRGVPGQPARPTRRPSGSRGPSSTLHKDAPSGPTALAIVVQVSMHMISNRRRPRCSSGARPRRLRSPFLCRERIRRTHGPRGRRRATGAARVETSGS